MRVLLTIIFLTVGVQSAHGALCSTIQGKYWYPRLKSMPISDKAMHCTLSCHLALKCSVVESWSFGRFKEFYDIFGEGNAEWADLLANDRGLSIAITGKANNTQSCLKECRRIY